MDRYLLELDPETKSRLDSLKEHPEEAYSQIINRLIDAYEDDASLTREEVEEIRQALRDLKEGRFVASGQGREDSAPAQETPPAAIGDPQAVKDMEALFSGTVARVQHQDQELTPPDTADMDPGDIHELDSYDRKGRARTSHLDSL